MNSAELIDWLLQGDVSVQYQTNRDLLNKDMPALQQRIATEGWGAQFLSFRNANGHWGSGFYQPKWTSSHYTILDLKNLGISSDNELIKETIRWIVKNEKAEDGGINPSHSICKSDVCINGMFLNYASYFRMEAGDLKSVADFILSQQMDDGGFNCHSNRKGAVHSSMHTTISILEGIWEYQKHGYTYKLPQLLKAQADSCEFLLKHKLYQSHRTGKIIRDSFLMLSYPARWYYDILRALDYFQSARITPDSRMQPALDILMKKRRPDGTWPLQAKHAGMVHFDMEKTGSSSRWNTLRALRVLMYFGYTI